MKTELIFKLIACGLFGLVTVPILSDIRAWRKRAQLRKLLGYQYDFKTFQNETLMLIRWGTLLFLVIGAATGWLAWFLS